MKKITNTADVVAFCKERHGDQKYGKHPYMYHLGKVVRVLMDHPPGDQPVWNKNVVHAAWLHDIVEDTDVSRSELCSKFSDHTAFIVTLCTDGLGESRAVRKGATLHKLRSELYWSCILPEKNAHLGLWAKEALCVKLADLVADTNECIITGNIGLMKMYTEESANILELVDDYPVHAGLIEAYKFNVANMLANIIPKVSPVSGAPLAR